MRLKTNKYRQFGKPFTIVNSLIPMVYTLPNYRFQSIILQLEYRGGKYYDTYM